MAYNLGTSHEADEEIFPVDWYRFSMQSVYNGSASFQVDFFGGAGASGTKLVQDAIHLPSGDFAPMQFNSNHGNASGYSHSVGSQSSYQMFAEGAGANPHADLSTYAPLSDTGSFSPAPGFLSWDGSRSTATSEDIFTPPTPVANINWAATQANAFENPFFERSQLVKQPEPLYFEGTSFGSQSGYRCSSPEPMASGEEAPSSQSTLPAPEPAELHEIFSHDTTTGRVRCICNTAKEISSKSNWTRHLREKTGLSIPCAYCEKVFNRPYNLHQHLGKYHPRQPCKHCRNPFPKPKPQPKPPSRPLPRAPTIPQQPKPKPLPLPRPRPLPPAPPLPVPVRKRSGYECPVCGMKFSKQDGLNQHIEKRHRGGR